MRKALFTMLSLAVAVPAVAQERGGVPMRNQLSTLDAIEANQGCPMSSTSVTVGVNRSAGMGSLAQQQLGTYGGGGGNGCRPLVSTQVVAGVNMALGRGSGANQNITAQGPSGALSTNTYTRGYNYGYGAGSSANQRISNQTGR